MDTDLIGIYKDAQSTWQLIDWALSPIVNPYGYRIERIGLDDIMEKRALMPGSTRYAALILPGSDQGSSLYRAHFGTLGFQNIRSFCWHGGMVMGICAGAGPLGTAVDWRARDLTRYTTQNANMVRGTLHGPVSQLMHPHATTLGGWFKANTARICIEGEQEDADLMYWGGGHFVLEDGEQAEVLARFRDVPGPDGKPAIAVLRKSFGSGHVVISNIHPEVSGPLLARNVGETKADTDVDAPPGTHRGQLIERLNGAEAARHRLLYSMITPLIEARIAGYGRRYG